MLAALLSLLAAANAATPSWEGCMAEVEPGRVLLACMDGSACTVAESRQTPGAALQAFERTLRTGGSRVVLQAEGGAGVRRGRAEGEPDVLVATETVRPGVVRLVSCVLTGDPPAAGEARFEALRTRGLPSLEDLLDRWAVPTFAGRALQVPTGCAPAVDRFGGRVACGLDQVMVATLPPQAGTAREVVASAGAQLEALARSRGVRVETTERPCVVAGRPVSCRQDLVRSDDPQEAPFQLVGGWDEPDGARVVRCVWAGDPTSPPEMCAQVIRPAR